MALQDDINNFGVSNTAAELLVLAACTANTTNNRIVSVATTDDLPDLLLGTISTGTVIFVDSLKVPVVAQDGCWSGLDNRQLRNDYDIGAAFGWGRNQYGQLGIGFANTTLIAPTPIAGEWLQVSAGCASSVGLKNTSAAWTWGDNSSGQLGDNTTINRSSPVSVVGGISNWCCVSSKGTHVLGLRSDGTVWSWGLGSNGQLGNSSVISRSSPVSIAGGFTDWCKISGGIGNLSGGVRTNGTLWMWGFGGNGELGGYSTNTCRSSPALVAGGFTDWCNLSIGSNHVLAVRSNGTLWGWGYNNPGKIGNGNATGTIASPVSVIGGFTDWCNAQAGVNHSVGLRTNGTLWAWGSGNFGMIGDNAQVSRSSPVSVVGGFTDWCCVSAGRDFTLGVRSNGTAWGWGSNTFRTIDASVGTYRSSPVSISSCTDWNQVSAGSSACNLGNPHSLGLRRF